MNTLFSRIAATFFLATLFLAPLGIVHAAPPTDTPVNSPVTSSGNTTGNVTSSGNSSGATESSDGVSTLANPLKFNSLDELLTAILKAAIQLGTVILTLALIYTGFRFVAARGNEEAIRNARTALMYTIIGGLILLGATAIQTVIQSTITSLQ